MEPTILHVDMDAFFAAVELLRHPELQGRPVVVGGSGERGVVAAASYEARVYGIHSAMPSVRAKRLCPHAVFLPGDHAHYAEVSARVMAIFHSFTPLVEPISLDEAFLDVAGARRLHGPAAEIAARIRAAVLDAEGLTCSVGVARVKFLAKLASEAAKPRVGPGGPRPGAGVVVVEPLREREFLHPLPVQALWGVGPATLTRLQRLGVRTVGQLAELPLSTVVAGLGAASGGHLHALANAVDPRRVEPDVATKSISHEETFAHDHHRRETLELELLKLSDAVARRLRKAGLSGRGVTLKVRFGDFRSITRSMTLPEATDSAHELAAHARQLLAGVDLSPGVRLIGLGVSRLTDGAVRQLTLDLTAGDDPSHDGGSDGGPGSGSARSADWTRAEEAVDAVRDRFGVGAVGPASLVGPDGLRVARRGAQQWGPSGPPERSPDARTTGG